jgi:outer membrane lipoprotein carrier protein
MRPSLTLAVAVGIATMAAAGPARAQSVDATIDRAIAAWAKVRTVRGTFEQTLTNPLTNGKVTTTGRYAQQRPNRIAIRFDVPTGDAIVADGTALWIFLPGSAPGQVIKRAASDRSQVPIDITGQFLDSPKTKYDISAAGTRTIDGHPSHGLLLVARKDANAPVSRATVWIGDDDALIREFESTEPSGVTRRIHLKTMEINPSIDASTFSFAIPKGVKIVDQTR